MTGAGGPLRPSIEIVRLKSRTDFLRVGGGRKAAMPGLVLQMRPSPEGLPSAAAKPCLRVGITVSRKVGGAVERNRAKRRLREAARSVLTSKGRESHDYVLIGRRETLVRPFALLLADLETALLRVHGKRSQNRSTEAGER